MKTRLVLVGVAALVGLVACGGGGGGKSFSDLKSKFDKPTGDLGTDNVKSVAAAFQEEQKASQGMGRLALSSVQGAHTEMTIECQQPEAGETSITCTCNGGGTVVFNVGITSVPEQGDPIAVAYDYNSCAMQYDECTSTVDGTGWVLTTVGNEQGEYCYSFDGTVASCGEPAEAMSIEYCYLDGQIWYLVEVGGDYFAVNGTVYDDGSFDIYVKDKDGEWHCVSSDGQTGSCEGANGETFTF